MTDVTNNTEKSSFISLIVPPADAGVRLDLWLSRNVAELSRSRIQQLIKTGHVQVAGRPVRAHSKVAAAMSINIEIPPAVSIDLVEEDIPLEVLYEDHDIIVVNKQAGLVVHPAAGHANGTLVNALLFHCKDLQGVGGELRPGIVHRIDKDTSGAIIAAKNEKAMESMAGQFKDRLVHKEYLSIVHGVPAPARGDIDTLVGRSRGDRKKMSARPVIGRQAITHYVVEKEYKATSLMRLKIDTGRTHQIRVHMAYIGHPIVGDNQYGSRPKDSALPMMPQRQMLHAEFLAFKHPVTGKKIEIKAALWPDMVELIKKLEKAL